MAFKTNHLQIDGSANFDGSIYQWNQLFSGGAGSASNVGVGDASVYKGTSGGSLQFRSIIGSGAATVSNSDDLITIGINASFGGEVNTASNLGSGTGWYSQKVASDLQFKSIKSPGNTLYFTNDTSHVYVEVSTYFASNASLGLYVKKAGDTMSGDLSINASLNVAGLLVVGAQKNSRKLTVYYDPGAAIGAGMDFGHSGTGGALLGILGTAAGHGLGGNKILFYDDNSAYTVQTLDFANRRIGILTTNPFYSLDVSGTLHTVGSGTIDGSLRVDSSLIITKVLITTSASELAFSQTGDSIAGSSVLRLQNRTGSAGALFENTGIDLVDFGFKPSTGPQANLRFEHRTSGGIGDNVDGEFQLMIAPTVITSGIYVMRCGSTHTSFPRGKVGMGVLNPSYYLDVSNNFRTTGSATIDGSVMLNNQKISGVLTPVSSSDAVNKFYVDSSFALISSINSSYLLKTTDTFTGNLTVNGSISLFGNLIQDGCTYETHAEHVFSVDDFITMRDGALVGLANGSIAGIRIIKPNGVNNLLLGAGNDAVMRVGWDVSSLVALAAREDNPTDGWYAYWDDSSVMFKTKDLLGAIDASYYTKVQVDSSFALISNVNSSFGNVYTKSQVDSSFALISNVNSSFGLYVLKSGDTMSGNLRLNSSLFSYGNIGVGTSAPLVKLHISGAETVSTSLVTSDVLSISYQDTAPGINIVAAGSSSVHRAVYKGTRSRGTLQTPTVPSVEDSVLSFLGAVYDTSTTLGTAQISFTVDGAVSLNNAPQRIGFFTSQTDANNRKERLTIKSNGYVGVGILNPSYYLDVSGNMRSTGSIYTDSSLWVRHNTYLGDSSLDAVTVAGDVNISGGLTAATKSFLIPHPLDPEKKLQYGSLESPYHGVRLTGEGTIIKGKCTVILPEYISKLISNEGISIQLTNNGHSRILRIDSIDVQHNSFTVKSNTWFIHNWFNKQYKFFWSFTGIRKDVNQLVVEK